MSEQNKQVTDGEALKLVVADAASTETFIEAKPDWVKGWRETDLVSPSPFAAVDHAVRAYTEDSMTERTVRTYEQEIEPVMPTPAAEELADQQINQLLESPEVDAALANVAAEAADDAQLDAALNEMLTSPEVNAMIENVAADAVEDAAKEKKFDPTGTFPGQEGFIKAPSMDSRHVTLADFKAFEARVEKAFKHAGFKF